MPATAVLLEILHPAQALTQDDVDTLVGGWRKRWFVRPNELTPAPPAVVTLAMTAHDVGHDSAQTVFDAIDRDKRAWAVPLKLALVGARDRGPAEDAEAEGRLSSLAFGGDDHSRSAQFALTDVRARLRGVTPLEAACELVTESPDRPGHISRGFAMAAIAHADAGSRLWAPTFNTRSVRALKAALSVAADPSLPDLARLIVMEIALETTVLTDPGSATITPHPDDVAQLEHQVVAIADELAP